MVSPAVSVFPPSSRAELTGVAETRHQHHNLDPTNAKCRGGLTARRKAPNPPNRSTDEVALERGTPLPRGVYSPHMRGGKHIAEGFFRHSPAIRRLPKLRRRPRRLRPPPPPTLTKLVATAPPASYRPRRRPPPTGGPTPPGRRHSRAASPSAGRTVAAAHPPPPGAPPLLSPVAMELPERQ